MDRLICNTVYPPDLRQTITNRVSGRPLRQEQPDQIPATQLRSTIVTIDSRDRNKQLYPKANQFELDIGTTFENVYSVELLSLEFPISDNIIKSSPKNVQNNILPWCNLEDYDMTPPFSPYVAQIRPGMYNALTLNNELTMQCNSIKRKHGAGDNHLWGITIDLDTNIVNFVSQKTFPLQIDPLMFEEGSNVVTVTHENHGFKTGNQVTILNCPPIFGLFQDVFINPLPITVVDSNTYTVAIGQEPVESGAGGGKNILVAVAAKFKLLWGDIPNSLHYILGFPQENSSEPVNLPNPISTIAYTVSSCEQLNENEVELLFMVPHIIKAGDSIYLQTEGLKTVLSTTLTTITISSKTSKLAGTTVGTDSYLLSFPDHGFNAISSIIHSNDAYFIVTTMSPHAYNAGDSVTMIHTNSSPNLDGKYIIHEILSDTMFSIFAPSISSFSAEATSGILAVSNKFQLYRCEGVGNCMANTINGKDLYIDKVEDKNTLRFKIPGMYNNTTGLSGGGENVHISSALHGWAYQHSNTIDRDNIFRPIKLDGENYCFLCSPQLESLINSGPTKNVFSKILLTEGPGSTVFNTHVPPGKIFGDNLLRHLNSFKFEVRTPSNTFYEFNDMDFSFTLEIKESIPVFDTTNIHIPLKPPNKISQSSSTRNGPYTQRVHRNQ